MRITTAAQSSGAEQEEEGGSPRKERTSEVEYQILGINCQILGPTPKLGNSSGISKRIGKLWFICITESY